MELGVSGKCKSVEVACKVNELWWADLKLCEQWLKVARKQLAGQECLIGAVESLSNALVHLGLVGRSTWKGKGKAVDGGSGGEESDEEDGEGEDANEGE